ncbi:hypothetical protein [Nocardia thailandica]
MTQIPPDPGPSETVVREVLTATGREQIEYHQTGTEGVQVTDRMMGFLRQVVEGKLPTVDVPEASPEVRQLTEELAVLHLPEWRNPAGRKLAEPTVITMTQAARIADYLVRRGYVHDPEREAIRWAPTPRGLPGPHDLGLHYTRGEDGQWPVLDHEAFWNVDDIRVEQLPDGTWKGEHPRGLAFQAATKSEALAGIAAKVRQKIEEAQDVVEG